MNLKIVFEDAHLLVLYKPAGVPVQSARVGAKDCESMLKNYLYEESLNEHKTCADSEKGTPYLGIIHRLDQPVEGLLVFAKTSAAAADLNRQLQDGRMKKRYLAVLESVDNSVKSDGKDRKNGGKLNENVEKSVDNWSEKVDFLRKNGKNNCSAIVQKQIPGAKKAVLRYRILQAAEGQKLAEIELLTGRHHQIRVQMAGMGTPIAGDQKYGRFQTNVDSVDKYYPALCAYRLEFVHPKTQKPVAFQIKPENPFFAPFCI